MNSTGSKKYLANVPMVLIGYNKLPVSSSMIVDGFNQLLGESPNEFNWFQSVSCWFHLVICKLSSMCG